MLKASETGALSICVPIFNVENVNFNKADDIFKGINCL